MHVLWRDSEEEEGRVRIMVFRGRGWEITVARLRRWRIVTLPRSKEGGI